VGGAGRGARARAPHGDPAGGHRLPSPSVARRGPAAPRTAGSLSVGMRAKATARGSSGTDLFASVVAACADAPRVEAPLGDDATADDGKGKFGSRGLKVDGRIFAMPSQG